MSAYNEVDGQQALEADVLIIRSSPISTVYARTIINANKSINMLMVDIGEQ